MIICNMLISYVKLDHTLYSIDYGILDIALRLVPCGTADTSLVVLLQQWGYKPISTPLLVL